MFKIFLAALAAACLFVVVATALGLSAMLDPVLLLLLALVALVVVAIVLGLRRLALLATAGLVAVSIAGCGTLDIAGMVKASDDNPDCYKNVHATLTPILLFGWAVPVIGGTFDKVCHADKSPEALKVGATVAPAPAPKGTPPAVPASDPSPA